MTKIGPESRAHESSSGIATTSTSPRTAARASASCDGSTASVTGSKAAIALTTAACSAFASAKRSSHIVSRARPADDGALVRRPLRRHPRRGAHFVRSLRVRERSSWRSTTLWISFRISTGPVAFTWPDSNASRQWRILPSLASSLKCERGTDRRTFASEAMSRVIFGPGDLDAEELDVPAAAQLELDDELELLERRHLLLDPGDGLLDERLGVRGRHSASDLIRSASRQPVEFRAMHAATPAVAAVFEPVQAVTTFEETVERLGTAIRLGLLRPGAQLPPERDLAEQLGHLALDAAPGADRADPERAPGRRARPRRRLVRRRPAAAAPRPSPSSSPAWRELLDYRIAIEVGAVVLAAERAGADDLARLGAPRRGDARGRRLRALPPGRRVLPPRPRRGRRARRGWWRR